MGNTNLQELLNNELIENKASLRENDFLVSKPHGFYAGVCDFYLFGVLESGILALLSSFIGKFYEGYAYLFVLTALVVINFLIVIIYHKILSNKTKWLSPGEQIAGRVIKDEGKAWINPYGINRWGLFLITIISVIIIGNEFDGAGGDRIYPFGVVIGKAISITLQAYGLVLIGRGYLKGSFIMIAIYLVGLISSSIMYKVNQGLQFTIGYFAVLLCLYATVTGIYYSIIKRRTLAKD